MTLTDSISTMARFLPITPISSAQSLVPPLEKHLVRGADEESGRVLIVDDDTDARAWLSDLLAAEGYRCDGASESQDPLNCINELTALVILDLHSPAMYGMELLRRITMEHPGIAVLVVGGQGDVAVAVRAMRLGAYDFVPRPFYPDDLILRVQRAFAWRRLIVRNHLYQHELESAIELQREALTLALGELRRTYQATLEALTGALDLRDKETEGHSRRVTEYSTVLARAMNVDDDALDVIRQGALLHDVGKIGIPDSVLYKPGPLTTEEWALIRKHPQIGYDLLKGIGFLSEAVSTIVLRHHERYDGTGYPDGLRGNDIPWGARIFAVSDTLDAITADRVYRKGRSLAVARAEISRLSGKQFDPKVVEAFMSIPDQTWYTIQNAVAILCSRMQGVNYAHYRSHD